ncbi:mutator type transposase [Tanacetum coccineum]|uniref:Mutator type transposase n=1 Tax=Tanacetum coccineum TaxID=301880 RepID=A0ABQ5EKW1_9ASTR
MVRPKQSWHFRPDDIMEYDPYTVYAGFPNIFSLKIHHGGKFTSRPNRKYVSGKVAFVDMLESKELNIEVLHKIVKMLKYPAKQSQFYQFKIPNKTLDWGLRALGKDDDIVNLIKYVSEHKVIDVYIEHHESLVESLDGDNEQGIEGDSQQGIEVDIEGDNEMGSEGDDEGSDGDNEIDRDQGSDEIGSYHSIEMVADQGSDEMGSEHGGDEEEFSDHDDDNIVDEEHIIDELEVNMEGFRFSVDDDLVLETLHPEVNVTENDLEVLDFDSFDSDIGDDSDSERRAALRKLKKEGKQNAAKSRITNYFFVGQEFPNKEEAKKRIKAKAKTKTVLKGDAQVQYFLLRDYVIELQKCNPNTIVKLDCYREGDPESTTRLFRRIYVCLGPLKEGFKAGGRELLGLYGAFMKGQYSRKLLIAVGVDGNNGIYPMPYRILESESLDSWKWFLTQLGDDLELYSNSNFTFITDRQKGLLPAIKRLFPAAEHKYYVRHIN